MSAAVRVVPNVWLFRQLMLHLKFILNAMLGRQAGFESPPDNSVYSPSIMSMPLKPGLSPAHPA